MVTILKKLFVGAIALGFIIIVYPVYAVDPPHREDDTTGDKYWCSNCHTNFGPNVSIKRADSIGGNPYLCLNCHTSTGVAEGKRLIREEQAVPGIQGRNHRWDSGPGGNVSESYNINTNEPNTSTGKVFSGVKFATLGTVTETLKNIKYGGSVPRTYKITIANDGDVGAAQFNWYYQDEGGAWLTGENNVLTTGNHYDLIDNIKITFVNGSTSSTICNKSFCAGDTWLIKVRPQINYPTTFSETDIYANLTKKMFPHIDAPTNDITDVDPTSYTAPGSSYGKAVCSTCHNQHFQANESFDPFSPETYTNSPSYSSGEGRHFQRINNEQNQLCLDCHSERDKSSVRTWTGNKLSHPVGVDFPSANTATHSIPKEPSTTAPGTDQINLSLNKLYGTATADSTDGLTLTDSNKNWDTTGSGELAGKYIRFVYKRCYNTDPNYCNFRNLNVGVYVPIASNTSNTITFSDALSNQVRSDDAYVIDSDWNPSNNFRFFDDSDVDPNNWKPSFTKGKVYCLTCHGPHWADSDETTYDSP